MDNPKQPLNNNSTFQSLTHRYQFQLRHLLVLFMVLVGFQVVVSLVHNISLQELLKKTQDWYQRDSAEKLANLTATAVEVLIESQVPGVLEQPESAARLVQSFNIIVSQQLLQQDIEQMCLLIDEGDDIRVIDNGQDLLRYLTREGPENISVMPGEYATAIAAYKKLRPGLRQDERIRSMTEDYRNYDVFVPFVPRGEYQGALFMRNHPDFSFITLEMVSSYDETAMIFTALILLGLLAMFFITSYTVRERDEANQLLLDERARHVAEQITHEKEALFTKRIYHTHHKAEKVMGFIKEDLRQLTPENLALTKEKIVKYANFVSRVIYDMKWYDPPLQTIRNPAFRTDLNAVVRFIVENIFQRVSRRLENLNFRIELDEKLPPVPINEFVVWEIIEPIIQNAIEHSGSDQTLITIRTRFDGSEKAGYLTISDNGKGLDPELLKRDDKGKKRIFLENISTKASHPNSGYGCYLSYEIARRCNWQLDAANNPDGGSYFTLTIPF